MALLLHVMHGMSYLNVSDKLAIGPTSVCRCVHECTNAVLQHMYHVHVRLPNHQEATRDMEEWSKATDGIPGIIGAIDCTEIPIRRPLSNKEDFLNRKGLPMIKVQALIDVRRRFIDLDVGWPGCLGDAGIFRRSQLAKIHSPYLQQFDTTPVVTGDDGLGNPTTQEIPAFILTDSAYPSTPELVPTYHFKKVRPGSIDAKLNQRLSAGRAKVENAFATLKGRFRILNQPLLCASEDLPFAIRLVAAICVLHNFLIDVGDIQGVDDLYQVKMGSAGGEDVDENDDTADAMDDDMPDANDEQGNTKDILLRRLKYLHETIGQTEKVHFLTGLEV